MSSPVIQTVVPIILLIGVGLLSRRVGVLRSGDERVLNTYVYYFALPALFLVNVAETRFTPEILAFLLAGVTPVIVVLVVYVLLFLVFKFERSTLYLLILSTVFGSLAFFGIPFITFAFPTDGERLATISAAFISAVSVTISLAILEMRRLSQSPKSKAMRNVSLRLSRNPLILSILFGVVLSLVGAEIPVPVSASLHMLGGTTSTVAIFMLGVSLYGRKYKNIVKAFKLSLLRIVYLPIIALLSIKLFVVTGTESSILVLMHGMPVAISLIVLSERYDFHKETVASLILVSTFFSTVYLNLWLLLLGNY
jgi:predicted permease